MCKYQDEAKEIAVDLIDMGKPIKVYIEKLYHVNGC